MNIFHHSKTTIVIAIFIWLLSPPLIAKDAPIINGYTLVAGHNSLSIWSLPEPTHPVENEPTTERIELGRKLFFDTRLSGDGEMSCATCHIPALGWADGLAIAKGADGKILKRATPSIINSAYNILHMWDGSFADLETQALSPLSNEDEMNMPTERLLLMLNKDSQYTKDFRNAYPDEGISVKSISMAIASFERTILSTDSPFDRWVRGEQTALTKSQVNGFEVFLDENKGNCVSCHSPPNFSDDGFHNIGIKADDINPDAGRFDLVPVLVMKGAFKTPTLRDIDTTRPYFHDGTAQTLEDVIDHYLQVDDKLTTNSPSLRRAQLENSERANLVDFLRTLTDTQHLKVRDADPTVK